MLPVHNIVGTGNTYYNIHMYTYTTFFYKQITLYVPRGTLLLLLLLLLLLSIGTNNYVPVFSIL